MASNADDVVELSPDQTPAGWSSYADSYDAWLAPITRRFARDLVRVLELGPGTRFLDVAAGTGALAIAAAQAGAEVLATDFAPGMVDLLRRKLETAGVHARVEVMDGQSLSVADASFDVAASLFGLIFFPDIAAGAAELRRVLRLGGRAAVVAWSSDGFAIQRTALEALAEAGVEQPARSTLPAAFRLSDPARLEMLLVDAGFSDVVVEEFEHAWPVTDPEALFRSIPSWSAPMRPLFERLTPQQTEAGAAAFVRLVGERAGSEGLPMRALVAIGSR
jgi:ubiquinone/menaquinone biosynthesis C-methylase UbiE